MSPTILVVDDDEDILVELERTLSKRGYSVTTTTSPDIALGRATSEDFGVVLSDLRIGARSGIDLCERIRAACPAVPVIVMTGFGTMEAAVETLRAGAFDFVTKPFSPAHLDLSLRRALDHRALSREVRSLRSRIDGQSGARGILGRSDAMGEVLEVVGRVAATGATVLVTGESGTGKELVARALHDASPRAKGPFVAVNCAALPDALLESELFGHAKGAFTDAKTTKKGLFLEATGGTLFLDEIGEMPLTTQAKLLRALEDRKVRPVGANHEVAFDARIVTATNRDIESRAAEGTFREDLLFRINVVHVELPPLRARGDDVLLLAKVFVRKFAERHGKALMGMTDDVERRLLAYPWPGNVRELQNAIERAVALARGDLVVADDLPKRINDHAPADILVSGTDPTELCSLEEVERRYIAKVMEIVGGSKSEAAKILGLDRSTLYRKVEKYRSDSS